jgi:hypothetical protein
LRRNRACSCGPALENHSKITPISSKDYYLKKAASFLAAQNITPTLNQDQSVTACDGKLAGADEKIMQFSGGGSLALGRAWMESDGLTHAFDKTQELHNCNALRSATKLY